MSSQKRLATDERGWTQIKVKGENTMKSKIIEIAKTCQEVNKAYCEALGDFSQVCWEKLWSGKSIVQLTV